MAAAASVKATALILAMVATFSVHAAAQSGCTAAIISLMPCLSYITGNSTSPSTSCCSQLNNVVLSQARCLCTVLNGGASQLGIAINQTQALTLPGACKVQTPPISQCNAVAGGPATSPAGSPVGPPTSVPATPSVPSNESPATPSTPSGSSSPATPSTPSVPSVPSSGSGSKNTPSPPSSTGESNSGSSSKLNQCLMLSITFLAAFVSSFAAI